MNGHHGQDSRSKESFGQDEGQEISTTGFRLPRVSQWKRPDGIGLCDETTSKIERTNTIKMISLCRVLLLPFLALLVKGNQESAPEKLVICNFSIKSIKRPGPAVFNLDDFDPTLCTHFIYKGSTIDKETHNITMNELDSGLTDEEANGLLNTTMSLRERNPQLRVLLGMCCIDEETWDTSTLTEQTITRFKDNVIHTLQTYGFDGLFFTGTGIPDYSLIVSALRPEFDKRGYMLVKLLSSLPGEWSHFTSDVAKMHDLLVVAGYWIPGFDVTEIFSPMQSLEERVETYLESGIAPTKLVVPVPGFSASYILCDRSDSGVSARICDLGNEGTMEEPSLLLLYHELMRKMSNASEGWIVRRDNDTGIMYGHSNSNLWASYEDPVSVRVKARYIIEKKLAGGMITNVDCDDFVGYNEEGIKFPLSRTLYEALRGDKGGDV